MAKFTVGYEVAPISFLRPLSYAKPEIRYWVMRDGEKLISAEDPIKAENIRRALESQNAYLEAKRQALGAEAFKEPI